MSYFTFLKKNNVRKNSSKFVYFLAKQIIFQFDEFFGMKLLETFSVLFKHRTSETKMKRRLKLCLRLLLVFQDVNKSNAVSSPATAALARPLMSKSPFSCCSEPPLGLGSSGLEQNTRPLNSSFNSWWKMTASCFWGSILHPMTEPVRSAVINLLP